jgi:hypothetical protein
VALALNQVPIDVLAERLGTTRGALYKTLHDARQRLRSHLDACGLLPDGWQEQPAGRRLRWRRRDEAEAAAPVLRRRGPTGRRLPPLG